MIDFDAVTELAVDAGHAIMEVYGRTGAIDFETKGDESPLTEADLAANEVIANGLARLTPEIPIVSEDCLLYTSPSPRDQRGTRMPSSA